MKQEPTAWLNRERDVITFDNLFPEMTPLYEVTEDLLRKEYERGYADAMGWKTENHLEHLPQTQRNDVLEEVAKEFDKMTALGDTSASFARFVRDMKNAKT
jgi:hypothetical protein